MNLDNKTTIYINMFVHYPEAFNAGSISGKFKEYLANTCQECYVMINSAPSSEEESLKMEIITTSENKETITINLKEFIKDYFNNQIRKIDIEFVSN